MMSSNLESDPKTELGRSLKALDLQRQALESESEAILSELNAIPQEGGAPMGLNTPLVDSEGYPRNDIDVYRARHLRGRYNEIRTDHKSLMWKIEQGLKKIALITNPKKEERDQAERKARMAPKPKPKYDPTTGKWVVTNWDGTIAGIENGHLRKFDEIPKKGNAKATDKINKDDFQFMQNTTNISSSTSLGSKGPENNKSPPKANEPKPIPFAIIDEISENSPAFSAGFQEGDLIVKFGSATYSNHRQLKAIAEMVPLAAAESRDIIVVVLRGHGMITHTLKIRPKPWNGRGLIGCHIRPHFTS